MYGKSLTKEMAEETVNLFHMFPFSRNRKHNVRLSVRLLLVNYFDLESKIFKSFKKLYDEALCYSRLVDLHLSSNER